MRLSEQEIINAICLHMAERKRLQPNQIEVEMMWDEDYGFSAEVLAEGRSQIIIAANILEAIERYLLTQQNVRVFRDQIHLQLEEEIVADINV
ncbi:MULTISPECIES: YxcD family protein [Paenibacillus]|uniref:YxcD family protein n=1 Tax=Paenibacillus radicis (ex Xue et al. 2023) TaxID=2972489 RepID=A0ABT1YJ09_9BACL|nr:YxcD family protein [Paenibacillus radicis (ex Xue et al. 2023)]MCR8631950.1 YxcD family protein [Paenibacillus radicis (ex Xue et al. 2023)]